MVGQLTEHLQKVKAVIPNNFCTEEEQKEDSEEMFQTFAKQLHLAEYVRSRIVETVPNAYIYLGEPIW